MLTVVPILLTILLSAADLVTVAVDDLSKAPRIEPLPDGLPPARRAPGHGRWEEFDRAIDDAIEAAVRITDETLGTYLPFPLDQEYYRRLRACERLPDAFQVQLDGLQARCRVDCEGRVEATEARCIVQRLQDQVVVVKGWRDWQVILLTAAAAAVAGGSVYVIMKATR